MNSNKSCPMCRMELPKEEEKPDEEEVPWQSYGTPSDCRMKNMNGTMISEQQILWVQGEARVSRGMAIRSLQACSEMPEYAAEHAEVERDELIYTPLTPDPDWKEPTDEMRSFWWFRKVFGEEQKPTPCARFLRGRHRFSGFDNWHNLDWEQEHPVINGYLSN